MRFSGLRFFVCAWLGLWSLGCWGRLWSTPGLWGGWLGLCALLCAGGVGAWRRGRREGALREARVVLRPRHLAQQLAQVCVYLGLALAWPQLREQLPLTLAQVCAAYLLDALWVWRREGEYRVGLSPTPIVLSLNLFLWFRDEVFFLQWALLWVALRSRGWWRWRGGSREGRMEGRGEGRGEGRNIFNPSAFALCAAALVLIPCDLTHITWGAEIAAQHGAGGDRAYLTIFIAGLIAHALAPVGWVTLSGSLTFLLIGEVFHARTGSYLFIDTAIPPAIFLGLTLLVTDPVTAPRGRVAQVLFGLTYALAAAALYEPLRALTSPAEWGASGELLRPERNPLFFDKVLAVPLLNLCVPLFERAGGVMGGGVERGLGGWGRRVRVRLEAGARWGRGLGGVFGYMLLWSLIFYALVWPALVGAPGRRLSFWEGGCEGALAEVRGGASGGARARAERLCATRDHLYALACGRGEGALCFNLAESIARGEGAGGGVSEGAASLIERAAPLWERACALGARRGCVALGVMVEEGVLPHTPARSPRALWERACWGVWGGAEAQGEVAGGEAGEEARAAGEGCFHLANALGAEALSGGEAGEVMSAARGSLRALRRACALGVPECAAPLERVTGGAREVRAWRCARGDPLACASLEP